MLVNGVLHHRFSALTLGAAFRPGRIAVLTPKAEIGLKKCSPLTRSCRLVTYSVDTGRGKKISVSHVSQVPGTGRRPGPRCPRCRGPAGGRVPYLGPGRRPGPMCPRSRGPAEGRVSYFPGAGDPAEGRARRRRVPRPGQIFFGFSNHLQTSFSLDMIGTLFKRTLSYCLKSCVSSLLFYFFS